MFLLELKVCNFRAFLRYATAQVCSGWIKRGDRNSR